jgi:hypothetical protein
MALEDILRKWEKQGPTEVIYIVRITGALHLSTQLCCTLARVASPVVPAKGHETVDRREIIFAGSPQAVFDNAEVIKTIRG